MKYNKLDNIAYKSEKTNSFVIRQSFRAWSYSKRQMFQVIELNWLRGKVWLRDSTVNISSSMDENRFFSQCDHCENANSVVLMQNTGVKTFHVPIVSYTSIEKDEPEIEIYQEDIVKVFYDVGDGDDPRGAREKIYDLSDQVQYHEFIYNVESGSDYIYRIQLLGNRYELIPKDMDLTDEKTALYWLKRIPHELAELYNKTEAKEEPMDLSHLKLKAYEQFVKNTFMEHPQLGRTCKETVEIIQKYNTQIKRTLDKEVLEAF